MLWYVYSIHTDHTDNRRYHETGLPDRDKALHLVHVMRAGRDRRDNYTVEMFQAVDDRQADIKADALRPYPRRPQG